MASITCPNCQNVAAEGTTSCPSCGNALYGASQPTATPPSAPYSPAAAPKAQIQFDWKSIGHVDRLVGGGTLVLFISLFLTWFSYAGFGVSGLTAHGYLYIVYLITVGVLSFKTRLNIVWILLMCGAGLVPGMTFLVEWWVVTRKIHPLLAPDANTAAAALPH